MTICKAHMVLTTKFHLIVSLERHAVIYFNTVIVVSTLQVRILMCLNVTYELSCTVLLWSV